MAALETQGATQAVQQLQVYPLEVTVVVVVALTAQVAAGVVQVVVVVVAS